MDRECIKKHRKEFEAWLEGKEIEVYDIIEKEWIDIDLPQWDGSQYRVKINTEVVHYKENITADNCAEPPICGAINAIFTNGDRSKVTCPDCLAKMLPAWVKAGQKAFYKDWLVTIEKYNPDLKYLVYVENGTGLRAWTAVSELTPAVLSVTYDYLAKLMPFAIMERSNCKITTVLSVSADEVWIAGKGCKSFSFKKFCETYLFPNGSEIGEWVKA